MTNRLSKRFEALDAFRGISAICVVVFHLHFVGSFTEWSFFRGSYIFVEFFFILSGFVLAHGYGTKEKLRFKPYIKARFFRIYPLHFVMLLVMLGLEAAKFAAYKFAGITFNDIPFTGSNAPIQLIPELLLIQSWFPATANGSFNYPSWSISIEFYLYIALFLTIAVARAKRVWAWVTIAFTSFLLLSLYPDSPHRVPFTGLACFFGGACIYMVFRKCHGTYVPYSLATLLEAAALVAVFAIVQAKGSPYHTQAAIVTFLATVFCFAFESGAISRLLKHSICQKVGTLSYSIYMIHVAIIFVITSGFIVLNRKFAIDLAPTIEAQRYLTLGDANLNNVLVLVILAFIVFCAHWSYKLIEVWGQNFGKKKNASVFSASTAQ